MSPDPRLDDGRADWLGDVIDGAKFESALFVLSGTHCGDENDRDAAAVRICLEATTNFQATQAGHHDVEQDEIGRGVRIGDFQRLFAARGDPHAVVAAQQFGQEVDIFRSVIYDEDALFG